MSVTKEQAEMFLGVAAGLKMGIVDVSKDILEKSVLVGADMICESQGEIDNLTEQLASQVSSSTRNNHMRIKELEKALLTTNNELANVIYVYNEKLKSEISCTDLDDPDYLDMQTCAENDRLLNNK